MDTEYKKETRRLAFEKLKAEGRLNSKVKDQDHFDEILDLQSGDSVVFRKIRSPKTDPAMVTLKGRIRDELLRQGNPAAEDESYIRKIAEMRVGEILEIYLDGKLSKVQDSKNRWLRASSEVASSIDFINGAPGAKVEYLQIKNGSSTQNSDAKNSKNYVDDSPIHIWWRFNRGTGQTNWENFPVKHRDLDLDEDEFLELVRTIPLDIPSDH